MRQLTIRGFDEHLEKRLRDLARDRGISLNRAALELMRRGAGPSEREQPETVGDSLDRFIGVWSAEDEVELLRAVQSLEKIDPGLWS
jgi:hypothetical protein